jgi:hypothetical protein
MASKSNPGGGSGSVGSPAPKPGPPGRTPGPRPGEPAAPQLRRSNNGPPTGEPAAPTRSPATPPPNTAGAPAVPDMGPEADLINTLSYYGLGDLATWAWNEHIAGKNDTQIMMDLRQTDSYKQRFPGMAALSAQGSAITEQDYINKENADRELIRASGLDPTKYASRDALGNLIGNGVSTSELSTRLNLVQSAVLQAPAEARQYLQANFGIGSGDLMNYFLDPSGALPDLQMKAAAAQIGGAAASSGFGYLDVQKALNLAAAGVSGSQAQAGFGKIATEGELTHNLNDGTGSVTNNDLIDAQLGGNGDAALKLQQVSAGRVARFQSGGTYAANQQGVSGLGVGPQGF